MTSVVAFLGALVIAAAFSLRGADRALLGAVSNAGFAWEPAIALAVLTGAASAAAMSWFGATLASLSPAAAWWAGGVGAILALARLALPRRTFVLREPTRSIFAFAMVLAILQTFDAVRFAALALSAITGEPLLVACGVFLGAPIGLAQPEKGKPRQRGLPE